MIENLSMLCRQYRESFTIPEVEDVDSGADQQHLLLDVYVFFVCCVMILFLVSGCDVCN